MKIKKKNLLLLGLLTLLSCTPPDSNPEPKPTYTVTFNSNGGSKVTSLTNISEDSLISKPDDPTKEGYHLTFWYKEVELENLWNFSTDRVTSDITLYAGWAIDTYTVSFDSMGGTEVDPLLNIEHGSLITKPNNPTRPHGSFDGWYQEENHQTPWNFSLDTVKRSFTLYAKWKMDTYAVSFNTMGGSTINDQTIEHGSLINKPDDPEQEYAVFDKWYKEIELINEWNFAVDKVTNNTTLYAGWLDEEIFEFTIKVDDLRGGETFAIPLNAYNSDTEFVGAEFSSIWDIDWGDGTPIQKNVEVNNKMGTSAPHTYLGIGEFKITITPSETLESLSNWLRPFSFHGSDIESREKIYSVLSPLTKLGIYGSDDSANNYIGLKMFERCTNLVMGPKFNLPQNITEVGDNFADGMFYGCTSLTMNSIFNLPQGITDAKLGFVASMFEDCTSLTMNSIFNLPQEITTAGGYFAYQMFKYCSNLTMNSIFNLPKNLVSEGMYFAYSMFAYCKKLDMNEIFNLPQNITKPGQGFVQSMFYYCEDLTMNSVFNLPQGITSIGNLFAQRMFYYCYDLTMNSVFNLPQNPTSVERDFANGMFVRCDALVLNKDFNLPQNLVSVGSGFAQEMFQGIVNLKMNNVFNFPQDLVSVGAGFGQMMFFECKKLTMNSILNLPQKLTSAPDSFANIMFYGCTSLTMNSVFNLPQNITSAGIYFASGMFGSCTALTMNSVFNIPQNLTNVGTGFMEIAFKGCLSLSTANINAGAFNLIYCEGISNTNYLNVFTECPNVDITLLSGYVNV